MAAKRVHRGKAAHAQNPEVPIQVEVLRAAMAECGWGPSELAAKTGDSQQTISALYNSQREDRRCRKDRARRIAEALQIPLEQLTKGIVVPPEFPLVWEGHEFRYSERTKLAASRLFTRCREAFLRDVDQTPPTNLTGLSADDVVGGLLGVIGELIQVGHWRHWLLSEDPTTQNWLGRSALRTPATQDVDALTEAAILGLCRAVELVLTPWFEGKAKLNYAVLFLITLLPRSAVAPKGVNPFTPAAAFPPPAQRPTRPPPRSDQHPSNEPSTPVKKKPAKRRVR